MLSVVIPALNAAGSLGATLESVRGADEVVVVDGGSSDGTPELATALGARVVTARRGRGSQLAAGVAIARGDWLLLLHADTRLEMPIDTATMNRPFLAKGGSQSHRDGRRDHRQRAYYFRFSLDTDDRRARRLERLVAWRCRVLALPYGDQGLLIHRDLLRQVGGIHPLPLMEDVDLVRRLGRRRLVGLDAAALTSAVKWQRDGWYRRSLRNLVCLSLYFIGFPVHRIAQFYK